MHLDLRPENFMRQTNPQTGQMDYRLMDLGMAQRWGDTKPHQAPANILFSSFGAMQGSGIEPWADHEALAHSILHLQGVKLPWFHCEEGFEVGLVVIGRISALARSTASVHRCSTSDDSGGSAFASHLSTPVGLHLSLLCLGLEPPPLLSQTVLGLGDLSVVRRLSS